MSMPRDEIDRVFESLVPGDKIELKHQVKVGFKNWETTTSGAVVSIDRRRHGLHRQRNFDDKVYSDLIILKKESGELTTVTIDEFSELKKITT